MKLLATSTSAAIFASIAMLHAAAFTSSASALQSRADAAVASQNLPTRVAEPIVVQGKHLQIVKAERIEVRASNQSDVQRVANAAKSTAQLTF